jgi:hypothetical protein
MKPSAVDIAIRHLEQRAQNTPAIAADQRAILRSLDAGVLKSDSDPYQPLACMKG